MSSQFPAANSDIRVGFSNSLPAGNTYGSPHVPPLNLSSAQPKSNSPPAIPSSVSLFPPSNNASTVAILGPSLFPSNSGIVPPRVDIVDMSVFSDSLSSSNSSPMLSPSVGTTPNNSPALSPGPSSYQDTPLLLSSSLASALTKANGEGKEHQPLATDHLTIPGVITKSVTASATGAHATSTNPFAEFEDVSLGNTPLPSPQPVQTALDPVIDPGTPLQSATRMIESDCEKHERRVQELLLQIQQVKMEGAEALASMAEELTNLQRKYYQETSTQILRHLSTVSDVAARLRAEKETSTKATDTNAAAQPVSTTSCVSAEEVSAIVRKAVEEEREFWRKAFAEERATFHKQMMEERDNAHRALETFGQEVIQQLVRVNRGVLVQLVEEVRAKLRVEDRETVRDRAKAVQATKSCLEAAKNQISLLLQDYEKALASTAAVEPAAYGSASGSPASGSQGGSPLLKRSGDK